MRPALACSDPYHYRIGGSHPVRLSPNLVNTPHAETKLSRMVRHATQVVLLSQPHRTARNVQSFDASEDAQILLTLPTAADECERSTSGQRHCQSGRQD
jgi:hypothetical protein